jgi:TonB-linked SusC/RagA family outer membrane protein
MYFLYLKYYSKLKTMKHILSSILCLLVGLQSTLLAASNNKLPPRPITGRIIDASTNSGLPGVSIVVKGSAIGTNSDANGRYTINVSDNKAVLVFSYVGYLKQEIQVGTQTEVNVTLVSDNKTLDEVIVTGYGQVRKSDLTGAVGTVKGEDLTRGPISSITQGLQGQTSGVQITRMGGQPGEGTVVRIRGGNSLTGGNEPLYVIDGVQMYDESGADLNPNDIESLEVLKDASATAVYGARGANGVILVTTKRGKEGKLKVDYQTYVGTQRNIRYLDLLNAKQYATLANARNIEAGRAPRFTQGYVDSLGAGTDWQREIFRPASIQNHQLNFSGGSLTNRYFISAGYYNEKGTIIGSDFKRYSVRANLDLRSANNKFHILSGITATNSLGNVVQSDQDGDGRSNFLSSIIGSAILFSPIAPVRQANGSFTPGNPDFPLVDNPVATALAVTNKRNRNRLVANLSADYVLGGGFSLKTTLGADLGYSKQTQYLPREGIVFGASAKGWAGITSSQTFNWISSTQLDWNRTLGTRHSIGATLVYELQSNRAESAFVSAQNFTNDNLGANNLSSASVFNRPSSSITETGLVSYLGRVNYSYNNRYLLTASVRRDGSSRFGANNRFAVFPSAALAWKVTEEEFMKNAPSISNLKIRASYGVVGNQEIGAYSAYSALSPGSYTFNNILVTGLYPSRIGSSDLKWETTRQINAGIDLGLFSNRIGLTVDYYVKHTYDLLFNQPLPQSSGFDTGLQNIGELQNKGVEFLLNTKNTVGEFKWSTDFNISFNRNKVVSLGGPLITPGDAGSGFLAIPAFTQLMVGEPVGTFYGFVRDGIFQNQAEVDASAQKTDRPGYIRYKDLDGNGTIDANDRTIIGNAQPDFIYGLTNNFSWKNFDLSIFIQGSQGNDVLNAQRKNLDRFTAEGNASTLSLDYWSPTNPTASQPSLNNPNIRYDSRYVEDGSYVRLKNLTFGYTFPRTLLSRIKLSSARLYFSGQNLITLTNYTGYDPEVSRFRQSNTSPGVDAGSYPVSRAYTLGLNVSF